MTKSIRQAVSVIFRHKDEIFIIKRQNYLRSFPGYTAFPGGKKDKEDNSLEIAAIREIREELQYDIASEEKLLLIAKATSPDFNPIRFETYFYLIDLSEKPLFHVDTNEAASFSWINPKDILQEFKRGKILLVPPIRKMIDLISENKTDFIDLNQHRSSAEMVPSVESIYGLKQIMPLSNTIPPAERTNAFYLGDTNKIIIDPSPKDQIEYEKLCHTIGEEELSFVVISHHHPDHHQYATMLATKYKCPIKISKDSYHRIIKKSKNYFKDIHIEFLKEGDVVTTWLGQSIRVYEIPGHDEGHLGFAPDSMDWFIVGDLFQGVGTVVVGGDEGHMGKYIKSLERIITLSPRCVIPSHGIALGGTDILKKTLKHRLLREDQIFELMKNGKSIDEILDIIYFNIPPQVLPYARANIISHINKLKEEGRVN